MSRQAADPRTRRRSANERHQQAFLVQVASSLGEFSQLLAEEPDTQDSVAYELRKMGQTADSLGLQSVARAANDAAEELEHSTIGGRALRRVANAIRHVGGRLRFGPLVVVGADRATATQLEQDARLCCEPLKLFDDLQGFAAGLHTEQPSAVALPLEAVDAVAQLVSRERFPVLVHGPANAWEQRAVAMAAGAHGFLVHPFGLRDVTRFARWRGQPSEDTLEVLLLADADAARDALARSMEQVGLATVTGSDPNELAVALERGTPRAVVIGARVGNQSALTLAQLVRTHPRCNHLPILVTGRPEDPAALRTIGVDDVMRTDAQPLQAAQRVRDRILRMLSLPWERDPVSGLANRLGVLDALDAELSSASRSGDVLAVVLIELDGMRSAIEQFGPNALYAARRLLVRLFSHHLRRADLFGELERGELLVALPGCSRERALERVTAVTDRFRDEIARDMVLKGIQPLLGAADSREGLNTVALRAERDLRASR
jgi:GGDEF domain-containing protein